MSNHEAEAKSRSRTQDTGSDDRQGLEAVKARLDDMSVGELRRIIGAAEALIQQKAESERKRLKEEVERRAADLGISLRDLFGEASPPAGRGRGRSAKGTQREEIAPKYRGPNGEVWSGRGRMPKWLQAAQADGASKDQFLVR